MSSFDSLPPAVRALISAGRATPSADNRQPWAFHWDGSALKVCHRDSEGFGPKDHPTVLSIGAMLENMAQAAEAIGVAISYEMADLPGVHAVVHVDHPAAATPLADDHPLFQRQTNRLPTKRDPLSKDLIARLESLSCGTSSLVVLTDRADIRSAAEVVKLASTIRFRVPEIHRILASSLRFSKAEVARGDGLDVATLGLPPGGAALLHWVSPWKRMQRLNRLGLYRLLAAPDRQRIRGAPAIGLVLGGQTKDAVVEAGRTLQRVWIQACQMGLAVHPYYAVTDQLIRHRDGSLPAGLTSEANQLAHKVRQIPSARSGTIHIMLRIAWPSHTAPRSLRLPERELVGCNHGPAQC